MGLNAIPVTVNVKNNGLNPIANFPINYEVDGGAIVTETFTGTIDPGDSADYIFTTITDISTPGNHVIKSWPSLSADENPYNDTVLSTITVINASSVTLPFFENFESFALCGTSSNCEAGVCALSNGWTNVTNLSGDDIDWRTNSGPTPGNQTGPDTDFDPGSASGKYLYLEAGGCKFKEGLLITPCLDLTSAVQPRLSYAYHMYGTEMGELHVDAFTNGAWSEDIVPVVSGNLGNQWNADTIDLSAWIGGVVTIRFRGITANGGTGDMALDAIGAFDDAAAVTAAFTVTGQFCVGETVTYTDNSTGSVTSYSWNFGTGATPPTANTVGPHNVVYSSAGNKTVTLTVDGTSGSDVGTGITTIDEMPTAGFTFSVDGLSISFVNSSTNGTSYLWDFDDGTTSTDANPIHTFANAGTYDVTLTVINNCGTVTITQTIVATGIETDQAIHGIFVYPNPSDDVFHIQMDASLMKGTVLSVYDVTGRKLFVIPGESFMEGGKTSFDLSNYAHGIYFLRINHEEQEWNYKVIH
jgi:PKD repeat protein